MLAFVGVLFGAIFAFKLFQSIMIKRFLAANANPVMTVSTMTVDYSTWHPRIIAVGGTRAIHGVDVTTELAGMVEEIKFEPGTEVQAGDILVQLKAESDRALLQALQATAELAKITYERDQKQFAVNAVSKQTVDSDHQNLLNNQALVEQQAAIVAKKTIRAPFAGRLGIRLVNIGQFINPGDKIVTLQDLDPIYFDFSTPQENLGKLKTGMPVIVTSDAFMGEKFEGTITTIDPLISTDTRNVQVEATIANPKKELAPGMFALASIDVGEPQNYLTLPQTAVSFNPYGDVVFVVDNKGKDKKGNPLLVVKQVFVKTGDTRGDQVAILQGLEKGQMIVTSGQLKLKNGTHVAVNNSIQLPNSPTPNLPNDHEG